MFILKFKPISTVLKQINYLFLCFFACLLVWIHPSIFRLSIHLSSIIRPALLTMHSFIPLAIKTPQVSDGVCLSVCLHVSVCLFVHPSTHCLSVLFKDEGLLMASGMKSCCISCTAFLFIILLFTFSTLFLSQLQSCEHKEEPPQSLPASPGSGRDS